MHFTNPSQLLIRNDDLLVAEQPLLVNMPSDDLAKYVAQLNKDTQLSFYDTNFEHHLAHKKFTQCHHVFSAQYQTDKTHDLIILNFPKSKNELQFTLAMLAHCSNETTRVLVVGENKGGIKSIQKLVKNNTNFCEKIDAARHCILFELTLLKPTKPFSLDDWFHYYTVNKNSVSYDVAALPGVFSQAKIDTGTNVLLDHMPEKLSGKFLDFGCGAGVIACYAGLTNPALDLHVADVSALALTSTLKTLSLNSLNGTAIATNSVSHIKQKYHHIVSNPPFHQGIKTHYAATENFLKSIRSFLLEQGTLTIVANSFLKYQPIITQAIGKPKTLCNKQGFSIYHVQAH